MSNNIRDKYDKVGNIFSVVVVIICALLLWGYVVGSDIMVVTLITINLICGPICFIMYLREVKRGVFRDDE